MTGFKPYQDHPLNLTTHNPGRLTMRLHVIRHGQTAENLQHILQGHLPGTLTDIGKEQVVQAAMQLKKAGEDYKCIVSSDLKRAMDSAHIIARLLNLPVIPMKQLRERNWGKHTGMAISEAAELFRKDGKWMFPEGEVESETEISDRARRALHALQEYFPHDTIIVVTHGLFARHLFAAFLGCGFHEVTPLENAECRLLVRP